MALAATEMMRKGVSAGDELFAADSLSSYGDAMSLSGNFGAAAGATQTVAVAPAAMEAGPQSFLETLVSPFVDNKVQAEVTPQAAAEEVPSLQDIQQQLDAIRNTTWKPEIAPASDKISTDVVRGNQATANMVTDANDKLQMINGAEQDLNKFSQAQAEGRAPAADNTGGHAGMTAGGTFRGLAFDTVATAGLAALNPVIGAGYAAFSLAKSVQQVQQAFTASGPIAGQGSFGKPTANSETVRMTKAEARDYRQSGNAPGRDSSPAQNTFEQAAHGGGRPAMAIDDMDFAMNNTRDSLKSIDDSPVPVKETPEVLAMRENIRSIKQGFELQKDTGEELQDVYKQRAQEGVETNADTVMEARDRGMQFNTHGGPAINGAMA